MAQYASYSGFIGGSTGGGGSVNSVTASSPISSSGGANPNISLSGVIPIASGGTGQATANAGLNSLLPNQATHAGQFLTTDGTNTSWNTVSGGSGTVTNVSVATANGLSGIITNPTTTPLITLSTTVTGLLQGNGTAISAAATGDLTDTGTDGITITNGVGSVLGTGTTISQHAADTSHNGYLSSIDWTTFNNKQATGLDWLLLGNAGSTAGTNFLGTTDTQSLVFKTNSIEAMRIDQPTSRLFIGTTTSIGGSNAGIQQADATTANRGQIKLHSYFNGTSISGVSTLTSRSGVVGVNAAVVAGQDYSKWTAQAAATTPGSAPISGTFSFKANTVNSLTVTSDYHLQLTNLAGVLGDRLYLSSEGLLQLPGYGAGVAQFDASGNVTSVAPGTNGNVLTSNGTTWQSVAPSSGGSTARVSALYDQVVGSSAQVTSGAASQTSINAAIAAVSTDGTILILKGSYTENVVVNKTVFIQGQGHGSVINGTLEFATGSNDSLVQAVKVTGDITIDPGTNEIQLSTFWQSTGQTINFDPTVNYVQGMRE